MRVVAGDIGGTHARFAIAELVAGKPPRLGPMYKYRTREHGGLASAWAAFERDVGGGLPRHAALAIAAPIEGEVLRFVNSGWEIRPHRLGKELGVDKMLLLNDFGAVAHAVSVLPPAALLPVAGPASGLPREGVTSVIGPGTGLGVAILSRRGDRVSVIETEGAHIAFSPQSEVEEAIARAVRARFGRCSVERVVSGPGLAEIHALLSGSDPEANEAAPLWAAALDGSDPIAGQALDILVGCFGAAGGDISLAHGSMSVVITGGLSNRMAARLSTPLFRDRFIDKGRYRERMTRIPVLLATEPEPGLVGAAVAFQREEAG